MLFRSDLRPAREVACHAIEIASAYAADLGCWDELTGLHALLEAGNGATRQRRDEREGGLRLLLRRLADETFLNEPKPSSTRRFVRHEAPAGHNRQLTPAAGVPA